VDSSNFEQITNDISGNNGLLPGHYRVVQLVIKASESRICWDSRGRPSAICTRVRYGSACGAVLAQRSIRLE
jgi:hypothetical protein